MAAQKKGTAISPTRAENFAQWYQQVIRLADLAENSDTRGCMIIKPWGYGVWEVMQRKLDRYFKETGHQNAYFPLLIPLDYFNKEAQCAEGFATECAVVTHHRLEMQRDDDGKPTLQPAGKLNEPYVIRPTSEMIIGASFAKWVESYRDLPLLINQWANVMRWEMRPRLFLRTAEFLWQEGHTAHATKEEAMTETLQMHQVYADYFQRHLALPALLGEKTELERFPGACNTYTLEVMVQDRKAIQAGTSHFLGQNFAQAQDICYLDKNNQKQYAWTTSWGVSTRLIGTMIMAHGDDDGLRLPPSIATYQVIIIPVVFGKDEALDGQVKTYCQELKKQLSAQLYLAEELRVHVDLRDRKGGEKRWEWIKKGACLIVEAGPKDLDKQQVMLTKRTAIANKQLLPTEQLTAEVGDYLAEMHQLLYNEAKTMRTEATFWVNNLSQFEQHWQQDNAGWLYTPWLGSSAEEEKLSKKHQISIRLVGEFSSLVAQGVTGLEDKQKCVVSGKETTQIAVWAKSY